MTGTKKIKLGWLFPYSGIFKQLKNDLQHGLETALHKEGANFLIDPYPEFIETGALKDTEQALNKLIQYQQVDLIIGVCSSKVILNLLPILEKNNTPLILLNLGADIPTTLLSSDFLFYNSLHLWKSEWVMGKWAQKKFGGEPSVNTSVYEGGYGLLESFKTGAAAAGAETFKLNLVKNFSSLPDTSPLIQYLKVQRPSHAHALLSGQEGSQFLQLFHEKELMSATHLTVNPFMAEDGLLADLPAGLELYNAMSWSATLDTPCNQVFTQLYEDVHGEMPNAFSLLAFEAGLALSAAMKDIPGKIARGDLAKQLGQVRPRGPRGIINLSTRPLQTDHPIYIRMPVRSARTGTPENKILETTTGIEWNDPSMPAEDNYLSGWQNPYLCV